MKKVIPFIVFLLVAVNVVLASWWVLHTDILFTSDIARDFFLLNELDQKKIILIGPNSSTGLFHGPLWTYLNYPAYWIGRGNPVVVGWFWIFLIVLFVISNYFIAKKLFGQSAAYIFALMTSAYMIFHAHGMYNPHGAMLLLPSFFYFFVRYLETKKVRHLVFHIAIGSAMIQFQLAVGIPLVLLSAVAIVIINVRQKRLGHVLLFFLVPVLLGNFILFDLRHQHLLTNLVMHFLASPVRDRPHYLPLIADRLQLLVSATEIVRINDGWRNTVLFCITLGFIALQIKQKRHVAVYKSFLYFYTGFFLLSLFNTGPLLYFYLFPIFPLVFLIFSSFIQSRYAKVFLLLFGVVYFLNLQTALDDTERAWSTIGRDRYSWRFLLTLARGVFTKAPDSFGYFVYAPNVLAYEGRYAMLYAERQSKKQALAFTKQPVTYLVIAPPPQNNPYMEDAWWRKNQVHIDKEPKATERFANGYKVETYSLGDAEIRIPFDPGINPGLHFR